jgi:hypothetical protein
MYMRLYISGIDVDDAKFVCTIDVAKYSEVSFKQEFVKKKNFSRRKSGRGEREAITKYRRCWPTRHFFIFLERPFL